MLGVACTDARPRVDPRDSERERIANEVAVSPTTSGRRASTTPIETSEVVSSSVAADPSSGSSAPSDSSPTPLKTDPDEWSGIELASSTTRARAGDTIEVSMLCPGRGTSFAASFEVVHVDLTFAMEEVAATEPDVYSTSFVVPYWLAPGELELHGGCPRPPGPCEDTSDCLEYDIDPTPVVTLPLTRAGDRAWDDWRPVTEPFLDPLPELGAVLPGGSVLAAAERPWAAVRAQTGNRLRVTARCPVDASTDGAHFVILPGWALDAVDRGVQWGWSILPDPEQPGRYLVSSDDLLAAERWLGEPLPWFVEVPASSTTRGESVVTIVGDIAFEAGLYRFDDSDSIGLVVTAVCEDVGQPFDPRSIDLGSATLLVDVELLQSSSQSAS